MALVNMNELIRRANASGCGVGSFSVVNMEMVIGTIQAAEELGTPVIIQLAEGRMPKAPLHLMAPMMVEAARKSTVDIAVHLDHGRTLETMKAVLDYGFTSIMMDGSTFPFEENIRLTKAAAELAAEYGAAVEGELGLVGKNEEGTIDHGIRFTDPDDAHIFCDETGVDALAIAIGNAHGNYPVAPRLAFDVLREVRSRVDTASLVLHGGSGINDADFQEAIRNGITKINIFTACLNGIMDHVGAYMAAPGQHEYFTLHDAIVQGTYETVKHHIRVFNMEDPAVIGRMVS